MKAISLFLLFSGWIVAVAAIALLSSQAVRGAFVTAGFSIQALGLVLLFRSHRSIRQPGDRT